MKDRISTQLGERIAHGGAAAPFSQSVKDRLFHTHIIGQTGTGKSTLLENLILEDIHSGRGVAVIDPKGDLAHRLLGRIPPGREIDVLHFNPADEDFYIPLNILSIDSSAKASLVRSNTVEALAAYFAESWGKRANYILIRLILTLQECPRPQSLAGVPRLLLDDGYRKWVVSWASQHHKVRQFWFEQYSGWTKGQRSEWTMPVINKLDLLSDEPLSHIIGQASNTYRVRQAMDKGKIIIIDLAKGRIGEENANLLGSLWSSVFKASAFARINTEKERRKPFFVYIDEFHNFTTKVFTKAFAELRGFNVGLTVAHQGLEQLVKDQKAAILENAGNLISFRIAGSTAKELETQFNGEVAPSQLTSLDNYEAIMKPMVKGKSQIPFRIQLYPPQFQSTNMRDIVIKQSREQFGRTREELNQKLAKWQTDYTDL